MVQRIPFPIGMNRFPLRYFIEKSGGHLDWNAARKLFMPVLSALSALHENGIGHYGISLDSLSIMENGKMKIGRFLY